MNLFWKNKKKDDWGGKHEEKHKWYNKRKKERIRKNTELKRQNERMMNWKDWTDKGKGKKDELGRHKRKADKKNDKECWCEKTTQTYRRLNNNGKRMKTESPAEYKRDDLKRSETKLSCLDIFYQVVSYICEYLSQLLQALQSLHQTTNGAHNLCSRMHSELKWRHQADGLVSYTHTRRLQKLSNGLTT